MAPRPTYDPPHVQLGRLMVEGRRRGLTFAVWWDEAMQPGKPAVLVTDEAPAEGAVRWPSDRKDRTDWRSSIIATREGWRRAFERVEPSRGESAIAFLADAIGALVEADASEPVRERSQLAA